MSLRSTHQRERFFAVGPALYEDVSDEGRLVANAIDWIISSRNSDGTWGGPDYLDRFITTTHAAMSLLAVGFSHSSSLLKRAIGYLLSLDTDKQVSFFWRSGAFLNHSGYAAIIASDMEYMWQFRRRVGAHKDYPVPFFLLKLLRFSDPKPILSFSEQDVLRWILDEWDDVQCWYNRTSITSMALALLYDLPFAKKQKIITRCHGFFDERYESLTNDSGRFHSNLVDDCFTVYNLCERKYILRSGATQLKTYVRGLVRRIVSESHERTNWVSEPPFGGEIGRSIYPTAVAVRALLSYYTLFDTTLLTQIGSLLVEKQMARPTSPATSVFIRSFWGTISTQVKPKTCFVLMPFDPKLTEIYERYVKKPIEHDLGLECIRADNIYASRPIMHDVWEAITVCRVIVADMTKRNPNVFYELGIAHAIGKDVILISQSIDDIPFDLQGVRTIIYGSAFSGYERLAKELVMYIKELGIA